MILPLDYLFRKWLPLWFIKKGITAENQLSKEVIRIITQDKNEEFFFFLQ